MIPLLASLHLCLSSLTLGATHAGLPKASISEGYSSRAGDIPCELPGGTPGWQCDEPAGSVPAAMEASDEFGFIWLAADAGRSRSRVPGRRGRCQHGEEEPYPAAGIASSFRLPFHSRWLWIVCAIALLIAGQTAAAQEPTGPPAASPSRSAAIDPPPRQSSSHATPALLPGSMTARYAADGPQAQLASRRQTGDGSVYDDQGYDGPGYGASGYGDERFPRRPFLGARNVVVTDPAEYPRPASLENNNPNSFWYSLRPNIFNVPVEPEWDFYNIINTDRPDFTDAVYSVGRGVTILETGYTYHKFSSVDERVSTRQLPESLLRHGITDEFELRLKWPGYLMSDIRDPATGVHTSTFGSQDIDVGFKYELIQQRGWLPMTTLVSGIFLPTGSRGLSANKVQPHFNIVAGWGFRRWLYLKWQTGADFLTATSTQPVSRVGSSVPAFITIRAPQNSWHDSISLLTQWTKRVGAFHEWFLISGTGSGDTRAANYLDMGVYLYATPNIQFDARIGTRLSNRVHETFTGVGFSGRW